MSDISSINVNEEKRSNFAVLDFLLIYHYTKVTLGSTT